MLPIEWTSGEKIRRNSNGEYFYVKRGGGAAAEYRIDRRKQKQCKEPAQRAWPLRVQGCFCPSALSGGQKQRPAIACAIFSGRRILILDESTSGLDGRNMCLIAEKLKSEARHGRTIPVITHDRELIESCCDNFVGVEKRLS